MNKYEFVNQIYSRLSNLPNKYIDDQINFYIEMIDDRIEEGLSEEDAINQIGNIDTIADEIVKNISLLKIAKAKLKPERKIKTLEIILIVLGSPIWLALLIALFAVVFSLYISIWALIICCWAIFVSFVACSLAAIFLGITYAIVYKNLVFLSFVAIGLILSGLSILAFYGSKFVTKQILLFTKKLILLLKKSFIRKEINN